MKHIPFYLAMILLPVLGLVTKNNAQVKGNKPYELSCFRITEERINLPPIGFPDTPKLGIKLLSGNNSNYFTVSSWEVIISGKKTGIAAKRDSSGKWIIYDCEGALETIYQVYKKQNK